MEKHPWSQYYIGRNRCSTDIFDSKLEQIQEFRKASIIWNSGNEIRQISNKSVSTNITSMKVPHIPYALYSVVKTNGTTIVLTPIFNEVVANDRFDLRFIRLTPSARDTLNEGKIDIQKYHRGSVICVTKMVPNKRFRREQRSQIELADMQTPESSKQYYWKVFEFFEVTPTIRDNIVIVPYRTSSDGNFYCVGDKLQKELYLKRLDAPLGTCLNTLLVAKLFTPNYHPGIFLKSLISLKKRKEIMMKCQDIIPIDKIPWLVLRSQTAPHGIYEKFESFKQVFAFYPKNNAYGNLMAITEFATNGVDVFRKSKMDLDDYCTTIDLWFIENEKVYFNFKLRGSNIFEKWNIPKAFINASLGSQNEEFIAKIISVTKTNDLEVLIQAEAMEIIAELLADGETTIFVRAKFCAGTQFSRLKMTKIPVFSNADLIIQSVFGNSIIPKFITDNPLVNNMIPQNMLPSQYEYVKAICDPSLPAFIASSSFGSGKSTTIARAAGILSHFQPDRYHIIMASTNSSVLDLADKVSKIENIFQDDIVRLVSDNVILQSEKTSNFDYPTVLRNKCIEVFESHQKGIQIAIYSHFQQVVAYLKSKNIITPTNSNLSKSVNIVPYQTEFNSSHLVRFFEEHQKPKIILGTIDTILQYFSTNWKHSLNRVATIQIDEFSMVPRSEFLQILSTFPNARYSFVGDYRQLAPFNDLPYVPVLSEAALGSPLEHMIHSESLPIIHFDTVFKCREEITQLLGTMFYFSTLQSIYCCDDYVQRTNQMLQQSPLFDQKQYPLIFIDTESEQSQSGTSAENESERNIAIALAEHLLKYVEPKDIGILCFYRGQSSTFEEWSKKTEIFVGSVDAAQGKTWPICIICTTRTLPSHKSPFIMNPRRINVALSKSSNFNFILGNLETFEDLDNWSTIIDKCDKEETIITGRALLSLL